MFLCMMVGQNPKNQMPKKLNYFISYDVILEYIYTKKIYMSWRIKKLNIIKDD
jgi:hypothetical protein